MERASDALSIDQIASRWIVSSDPEDTLSKIRPYVDAGFNHLVFHAPGKEQRRLLAAFTEQVLPGLRGCG
jgi:coenzyme F420-dependent glucose-6-phosphate dehydrogenase